MGISKDEVFRMKPNRLPNITNVYPLIDLICEDRIVLRYLINIIKKQPQKIS